MKNFKKVLALVLVVVMAMSFATVSNAAFTDAESITKAEAVDVLSAIGVINGYEDGSFKPEGNVTRAEMAKMIATILNKGEDVGAMYAAACTFADAANHWAAGYIAYCAQEGIINGKNATTFDPDANVTGTEAAKMVLGALGHKADKAGLVGSAWASTTLSLAKKNNLIGEANNMTANMGQALNRENAAQLLLNGLKATMVEYTGGTNITIGNVVLNQGATANDVTNTAGNGYDNVNDGKTQLVEEYFPDLDLATAQSDAFDRVGNAWTYETEPIGTYAVAPTLVYTTAFTGGQLYTDLGKVAADQVTTTYFEDGVEDTTTAAAIDAALVSGNKTAFGGQGVTVEVYYDDVANTLRVIAINTYAGKISAFVPAVKNANGDVTQEAYITLTQADGSNLANTITGGATISESGTIVGGATILAGNYTKADIGTIVYYTVGQEDQGTPAVTKNVLQSVATAQAVTGTNKGTVAGAVTNVTIDSTTYPVNVKHTYTGTYDVADTIYLDANGNIVYNTTVASQDYALVLAKGNNSTLDTSIVARLLFADGTVKDIDVYSVGGTVNAAPSVGAVYSYVVGADGKYALTAATVATSSAVANNTPTIDTGVVANANTVFVVGEVDQLGAATYTVYTGINNVPGFSAASAKYSDGTTNVDIRYVADQNNVATFVFCANATVTPVSTGNFGMVYKTGTESYVDMGAGNQYFTVKAVVDGAVTTVKVDANTYNNTLNTGMQLFEGGNVNANGIYTALTLKTTSNDSTRVKALLDASFVAYENGVVTLDGNGAKFVDATVPAYVWNQQTDAIQAMTIADLYDIAANGLYTVDVVSGAVTAVYAVVAY